MAVSRTELDVEATLHGRLQEATKDLDIDVAWPATPYTPVQGTSYIRPEFIPATNNPMAVGENARNRTTGFYQISVLTPATKGKGQAKDIVDYIYPYFRRNTVVVLEDIKVRITSFQIYPLTGGDESVWHTTAVRVFYRSDINN